MSWLRFAWLALWWLLLVPLTAGAAPSRSPLAEENRGQGVVAGAGARNLGQRRNRRPAASKRPWLSDDTCSTYRLEPEDVSEAHQQWGVGGHPGYVLEGQLATFEHCNCTLLLASTARWPFVAVVLSDNSLARAPPA